MKEKSFHTTPIVRMWGDIDLFRFKSFCYNDNCASTCTDLNAAFKKKMRPFIKILKEVQDHTNFSTWSSSHMSVVLADETMTELTGGLSFEMFNLLQEEKRKALNKFVTRISSCVVSETGLDDDLDFELFVDQLYDGIHGKTSKTDSTAQVWINLTNQGYPVNLYTNSYQTILHELLHVSENQKNNSFRVPKDKQGQTVIPPFYREFSEEIWAQRETYQRIKNTHDIEPRYHFHDQQELKKLIDKLREDLIESETISEDDDYSDEQIEAYFLDKLEELGANEFQISPTNPNFDIKQKLEPCESFQNTDQ